MDTILTVLPRVSMVTDKAAANRLLKALLGTKVVLGDGSTDLLLQAHTELKIRKS